MKKSSTFRFEETKLSIWKTQAEKENRSLTNFIETVITDYVSKKNKKSKQEKQK